MYQIWCFFIPSFYKNKRVQINKSLIFYISFLFIFSVFLYFLLLPEICNLLLHLEIKSELVTIKLQARIYPYIKLTSQLFVFLMLILQSPLLFYYISTKKINKNLNNFDRKHSSTGFDRKASSANFQIPNFFYFIKYRKYFLLICIVLASILTPPDILVQLLLSFSFFFSFECTFLYSLIKRKLKKNY